MRDKMRQHAMMRSKVFVHWGRACIQCYRCGGMGHMAKECTTPYEKGDKGKGKSGSAGLKGGGWKGAKGGGKGDNKGGKKGGGKGKSYLGTCFACGRERAVVNSVGTP